MSSGCRLYLMVGGNWRTPAWISGSTSQLADFTFRDGTLMPFRFKLAEGGTASIALTVPSFNVAIPRTPPELPIGIVEAIAEGGTANSALTVAEALIAECMSRACWSRTTQQPSVDFLIDPRPDGY